MIRLKRAILIGLVALGLSPAMAPAQTASPFAPVVIVNERPVTRFEVDQRVRILRLFRTTGDVETQAIDDLVDDRLRMSAASAIGIAVTPEMTEAGMEEFAQRANMDAKTFVGALEAQGVAEETFRDFINAGMIWREVVRIRFGPRVQVTDEEVERALAQSGSTAGAEVRLAEIILPARNPEEAAQSEALANRLSESISSTGAFAAAARQYSLSGTRESGGRLPRAVPLSELPPPIRAQILTLSPGGVTDPIVVADAVAIFQLIELRETGIKAPANVTVEYAVYLIPGGRSEATLAEAAKIAGRADTCNDLYGINKGQPPERLTVRSLPASEVPGDVAMELAKLDPGEISTALTRGGNLELLMLCARKPVFEEEPDRELVRNQLVNQRLAAYGEGYLAELRADALILYP